MNDNQLKDWEDVAIGGPQRVDRFLHGRLPGFSMSRIRDLIKDGKVLVNGRRARKGDRVQEGDEVRVAAVPSRPLPLPDQGLSLQVAYEDEDLAVAEKPSGMPTHPLRPDETGTLVNAAVARWPELRGVGDRELEPGLLHRLDTGTSGLVMFAKNRNAFEFMRHEMKMHRVSKIYRALVKGEMERDKGEVRVPLARSTGKTGLMVAAVEGARYRDDPMEALTRYRVLERKGGITLVELDLVTGVMHQLRAHLAFIAHPVLGDDRYGDHPDPLSRSFALQSSRLSLTHPTSGARVEVKASQPLQMKDAANWLIRFS